MGTKKEETKKNEIKETKKEEEKEAKKETVKKNKESEIQQQKEEEKSEKQCEVKGEEKNIFFLEKQSATKSWPGKPGRKGLYLTNPENSDKLVLAEQDFSPSQVWSWSNNMLKCRTGKVLAIDGSFNA